VKRAPDILHHRTVSRTHDRLRSTHWNRTRTNEGHLTVALDAVALKVTTQGPVAHAAEADGMLESIVLEFKIVPEFKYR
jgi:hypothetical protein